MWENQADWHGGRFKVRQHHRHLARAQERRHLVGAARGLGARRQAPRSAICTDPAMARSLSMDAYYSDARTRQLIGRPALYRYTPHASGPGGGTARYRELEIETWRESRFPLHLQWRLLDFSPDNPAI